MIHTVILTGESGPDNHVYMCKGGTTVLTCNTTTSKGFLLWNIGSVIRIFAESDVGDTKPLPNNITLKLSNIETSSSGIKYTSTAKLQNVRQRKTVMCSDSTSTRYYSVKLLSKFTTRCTLVSIPPKMTIILKNAFVYMQNLLNQHGRLKVAFIQITIMYSFPGINH